MARYLAGRCPKCSKLVPACTLPKDYPSPVFEPTLCVVLKCPNCGKEFPLLASLLGEYHSTSDFAQAPTEGSAQ